MRPKKKQKKLRASSRALYMHTCTYMHLYEYYPNSSD